MRRTLFLMFVVFTAVLSTGSVPAAVTVDLATLAPDGSPWHKSLQEMGNDWSKATEGRVRLRIFPGGVAGDDSAILRKIRIARLDAGGLTVNGLSEIDDAFNVFAIPLFFESYEEFSYVLEQMMPVLRERIEAKGFVLLNWGHGGWIHIFSKKPVHTVDELKRTKMYTSAGDHRMTRVWQEGGFRPVPLSTTDVLTALQTGMIEAIPVPPVAALSLQWFRHTPYMLDPGVAPLIGGTVISRKTWSRISPEDRASLLAAAREMEDRLAVEIPEKDRTSVTEMEKRGLEVIHVGAGEQAGSWKDLADSFAGKMQGFVPEDIFRQAVRHRTEFRTPAPDPPSE